MTIRVLFFSVLRDLTGVEETELVLEGAEPRVEDATAILLDRYPELGAWKERWLVAVDCEYANSKHPLSEGAELALFPPVQGG